MCTYVEFELLTTAVTEEFSVGYNAAWSCGSEVTCQRSITAIYRIEE
jgi:hypothetical protein